MIRQIEKDEDLYCLLKLHETVQKVKTSNTDNSIRIRELRELFNDLQDKIQTVSKEQSKNASQVEGDPKKKDEPGKKKK
eukprot:CAMPEP_0170556558 /NCGR_PEP_ID=MMETSP0211-20121228/17432_1 /TAXON_ID=311385 /ORGANISM="Pseudokeronopsis sp., Strain OXSARD2" /LENGTH=78 /DNA_ID=CAMNT_0010866973 /DNA_START=121 /DNA_END=357 /DNA_ORIENTATION=-